MENIFYLFFEPQVRSIVLDSLHSLEQYSLRVSKASLRVARVAP